MNTIDNYMQKLDDLAENFDIHIRDIVIEHKGQLLSTVKLRLFRKSIDANGLFLGEYKWDWYKKEKKEKGLPSNRITLRHTGKLYNSMFVEYKNRRIVIDAADEKIGELEDMFGDAILDLSEEEITDFVDTTIEPEINKQINNLGDLDIGVI